MTFEELFPSLDGSYETFNKNQKDLLQAVCIDKQRIEKAIEKVASKHPCPEYVLEDLKQELGLE